MRRRDKGPKKKGMGKASRLHFSTSILPLQYRGCTGGRYSIKTFQTDELNAWPGWHLLDVKHQLSWSFVCVISSRGQLKKRSIVFPSHSEVDEELGGGWVGGGWGETLQFVLSHLYEWQSEGWLALLSGSCCFHHWTSFILVVPTLKTPKSCWGPQVWFFITHTLYGLSFNCTGRFAYYLLCFPMQCDATFVRVWGICQYKEARRPAG